MSAREGAYTASDKAVRLKSGLAMRDYVPTKAIELANAKVVNVAPRVTTEPDLSHAG